MKTLTIVPALAGIAAAFPPGHHGWPHQGGYQSGAPVVSTSSGHITGKIDPDLPNVAQYLGIPYAVPPVGDLRWTSPQLLDQPDAQIEATELPVSCQQVLNTAAPSVYNRDVLEFNLQGLNRTGAVSEDCLTVSVWAPAGAGSEHGKHDWQGGHGWGGHGKPDSDDDEGLPVLIFIYGGGFQTGGTDVPYQIPAQWVNRTPNHIVVTFNYRLNIFGYPNAAGLEENNFGLQDQRAVVEWCQQNIAAFGGNFDKMVLWGQSAGSISVDYYNYAHYEDPIVGGYIMDSGTAFSSIASMDSQHTNFTFVAQNIGCTDDDPAAQVECMRGVDATTIEDFLLSYAEAGTTPALGFDPVPDEELVFSNYTERAYNKQQSQVPAIVGTNAQDGVPFVPYNPDGVSVSAADLALRTIFFCPSTETVRVRQRTGLETYRYLYAGNFSNVAPRPWEGASHSAELPMLMGTHPNFRMPSTALEYATSHAFQDAYVAFASNPENGLASQDWEPYTQLGADQVREFGDGVAAQDTSLAAEEARCVGAQPIESAE